jgi:hypothetical protein
MDDVEIEVLDEACVVRKKQNSLDSDGAWRISTKVWSSSIRWFLSLMSG